MTDKESFNPIEASRIIEKAYRDYLATTIHFEDRNLQEQLEEILARPHYLAKGPFLEATPPYSKGKTLEQLIEEGVLDEGMRLLKGCGLSRSLYKHQEEAIRKASSGKNIVIVTGTGSGKTECFLLPIINDIVKELGQNEFRPGVRALLLYPMNALANDQLKRLRSLLVDTNITFGRYTGDTEEREDEALAKWGQENPGEKRAENELISRESMRKAPPNILLTNYSMLEYLLLRPQDEPFFAGAFGSSWRHLVVDEAHMYSGALGSEIAFLLRRLKARIAYETGEKVALRCYATSATIGSAEDMPQVAQFAQDLFGEPFSFSKDSELSSVVVSEQEPLVEGVRESCWGRISSGLWSELKKAAMDDKDGFVRSLIETVAPGEMELFDSAPTVRQGLGRVLLGEESSVALIKTMSEGLLDLTDPKDVDRLSAHGLESDWLSPDTLSDMVEVLSWAQRSEEVPVLSCRYHSFLRAPEGLYINLAKHELVAEKTMGVAYDGDNDIPVYEISVCRHCGQAYVLGKEKNEDRFAWLDPRHPGTYAGDDYLPREYYRVLPRGSEGDAEELEESADAVVEWLCPLCGSLGDRKDDGAHRFDHEPIARVPLIRGEATEEDSRCAHCGYTNPNAIQPMRVSPEAAGSVVCYELVRRLPPFDKAAEEERNPFKPEGSSDKAERPGSVICFSDKRQDAAFFAPDLERTYGKITKRQLIREAVERVSQEGNPCFPGDVIEYISEEAMVRYPALCGEDCDTPAKKKAEASAWMIDELEATDGRNSLEGLGVVRVVPSRLIALIEDPCGEAVQFFLEKLPNDFPLKVSKDDYAILLRVCLESLRKGGGISVSEKVQRRRDKYAKCKSIVCGDDGTQKEVIKFAGSPFGAETKRSKLVRKYAKRVHGIELSREEAISLLKNMYEFLWEALSLLGKASGDNTAFKIDQNLWELIPAGPKDAVYVCDTCGCECHYDTKGVCPEHNCAGRVSKRTFDEALDKDRYYKKVYQQPALPLVIEEHTAQLSSKTAREIQLRFINGKVHVLSCTTTFELGVDVGDLRAVFLRNIPPKTANYVQRVGRTGRRAGKPGYAITFARLRPHDIAFFKDPKAMIKGRTNPPVCYLDNHTIAIRHVFAVALSQYFREASSKDGVDLTRCFNDFLSIEDECSCSMDRVAGYFVRRPEAVVTQLRMLFEDNESVARRLGIEAWNWISDFVGEDGRLARAQMLKRLDYMKLSKGIDQFRAERNIRVAHALEKSQERLMGENTIKVLVDTGVLPKYGFPTDLVQLFIDGQGKWGDSRNLELQRGLRQAIREYAPGAEIVAGKKLWKATGVIIPNGREPDIRKYGKCDGCQNNIWSIDSGAEEEECPVCGTMVKFSRKALVPSYGMEGEDAGKGVGVRRPRTTGRTELYFTQRWPDECQKDCVELKGGTVEIRYASNAQLFAVNSGDSGRGFNVCPECGAAASRNVKHRGYCSRSNQGVRVSLGAEFISDVLELVFQADFPGEVPPKDWRSLLWALFASASLALEIPEGEIGGTLYCNAEGCYAVMLFDDVPGGAGHALQLKSKVTNILEKAYEIVSTCTCGEETCCYGCIGNYYNQAEQHDLSRGAAKRILETLLGYEDEQLVRTDECRGA